MLRPYASLGLESKLYSPALMRQDAELELFPLPFDVPQVRDLLDILRYQETTIVGGHLSYQSQLVQLARIVTRCVLGDPIKPVLAANALVKLVTAEVWRHSHVPGVALTWFMVGKYIESHGADCADPVEIMKWYFFSYLREPMNDRFITPSQIEALSIIRRSAGRSNAIGSTSAIDDLLSDDCVNRLFLKRVKKPNRRGAPVFDRVPFRAGGCLRSAEDVRYSLLDPMHTIYFMADGNFKDYAIPGTWHAPEQSFCYANGSSGEIYFVTDSSETDLSMLDVDLRLVTSFQNRVFITINARIIYSQQFSQSCDMRVVAPLGYLDRKVRHLLGFHVDSAYRPAVAGSHDERELGVSVQRVRVTRVPTSLRDMGDGRRGEAENRD